jgi:hypothetical protein
MMSMNHDFQDAFALSKNRMLHDLLDTRCALAEANLLKARDAAEIVRLHRIAVATFELKDYVLGMIQQTIAMNSGEIEQ